MKYSDLFKIFDRIISIAIYAFPFLELYGFFNPFLRRMNMSLSILEDAASVLRENGWVNFVIFTVIITLTQSRKLNLSYFTRYNMIQSLVILFFSSFMDTCGYLFPLFVLAQGSIGNAIFNSFCFACLVLIIYCVIGAFIGTIPYIPLLSESLRLQVWDNDDD